MPTWSNMSSPAVSIIEPDAISPMMLAGSKDLDDGFNLDRSAPKQRRAKVAGRLMGRHSDERMASMNSRSPWLAPLSPNLLGRTITASPGAMMPSSSAPRSEASESGRAAKGQAPDQELYGQIRQWLEAERSRKARAKAKVKAKLRIGSSKKPADVLPRDEALEEDGAGGHVRRERRESDASEGTAALDKLEELLDKSMVLDVLDSPRSRRSSKIIGRKGSLRRMRRMSTTGTGSDTDYFDGVPAVPSCDVVLDNSKTLAYSGGASDAKLSPDLSRRSKEIDAWTTFKYEIVRLTHTLRLKGWRRVAMDQSRHITVERLSGALTNAVYVVLPPKNVPDSIPGLRVANGDMSENDSGRARKPPPMKLLLRIYGPNVEHLIDRESELAILRRLAMKRIGPRLLGTFSNGRFEEFLNAKALHPRDLRNKETSRQIAKRFRELHDGIELLQEERDSGPFLWKNWDKWIDRCAAVCQYVDREVLTPRRGSMSIRRGSKVGQELLCGTTWEFFHTTVEKYRKWLEEHYGGFQELKEQLVFAHNDSQYGNILRLEPPGDSPLLVPANHHKQLVVIDFEYANANMPGLEFANHFTEWAYDYHNEAAPHACNTALYPSLEEQRRFIEAYVRHRPQYRAPTTPGVDTPTSRSDTSSGAGASAPGGARPTTPRLTHKSSTSSLPAFLLDARIPAGVAPLTSVPAAGQGALDRATEDEEKAVETEVSRLLRETRLWRLANSAQWVAWGIVQAKVAGMPDPEGEKASTCGKGEVAEPELPAGADLPSTCGKGEAAAPAMPPGASLPSTCGKGDPSEPEVPPTASLPSTCGKGTAEASSNGSVVNSSNTNPGSDPLGEEEQSMKDDLEAKRPDMTARPEEAEELETDEFDYLAYAHERALFFWGDALQMGVVKEEDLPGTLRGRVKLVEY
ncbi:MAG: hypothetical protein INR71_01175 [Terriglobus roseus]|nr:hypothetical protein [Terriglobus roseus]